MSKRLFAAAVLAASAAAPVAAANDFLPAWFVYAISPVCQVWSDGVSRCFPVALVGPAPAYMPPGLQPLMPRPGLPAWPVAMAPAVTYGAAPPATASATPAVPATPAASAPSTAPAPSLATTPAPVATAPTPTAPATPATVAVPAPPSAEPPALSISVTRLPAAPAPATTAKLDDALAHFDFNSDELSDVGRKALDDWWTHVPKDTRVRVTGHADRFGPAGYNHLLSLRRAQAVMRHLAGKGMRPNDIAVAAEGETMPVVVCPGGPTPATKACLAPNRRVEIASE